MKVNKGSLWLGKDWEEAIILSLKTADCGIEEVIKYKNPNKLLCDEKVFVGYRICAWGSRKKYYTRVPKQYNSFVKECLENKAKN